MSRREYEAWYEEHAWSPAKTDVVELLSDLTPVAWLAPRLSPRSFKVKMTCPVGYEAYARLFFPFIGPDTSDVAQFYENLMTWRRVAEMNGRVLHPLAERETISAPHEGEGEFTACIDTLSDLQAKALREVLLRYTSSEDYYFLLWDGFGDLNEQAFAGAAKVHHEMREWYLFRGPLRGVDALPHDPSYLWPSDRAWCVAGDIDFEWVYLAGSQDLIDEVVALDVLDAIGTDPENDARSGMDVVNDPGGIIPRD
jgi:hypothetical protein